MKNQTTATPIRFRRKPLITALEPRILLDGAAVATTAEMTTDVAFQDESVHTDSADQSVHFAAPAPNGSEPGTRREVAFVDTAVEDYQSLVDGLGDNVEVILIDGSGNGLEQMVAALQGQEGIDAIHLFSHGDVGELKLGTLTLNTENLDANAELLSTLGESLTEAGDLMLYGCYVGADSEGRDFIDSVASLTQADVAASEDLTGAESLGGDWELEATSGSVEALALVVDEFDGLLAPSISGLASVDYTEGGSAVTVASGITFTGGANYGDGYVQFDVTAGESLGDQLALASGGNISISGSNVYHQATLIGTIDSTLNGTNGNALRINLINQTIPGTSPVLNGDFSAGMNNWTAYTSHVDLGVTSIAGWLTPSDSLINYDSRTPGLDDNDLTSGYDNPIVQVDAGRLRLEESSLSSTSYGVVHGPAAFSDQFVATAGMVLKFDWQANNISDDYHVVGYLLNADTGAISIALQSYGTTGSGVGSVTVPTDGNYRFVFISGTFDKTGGRALGASMYIDNIRVEDPYVTDIVVTDLAQQVTYVNSSDDSTTSKTITVSALNSLSQTASSSLTVNVEMLNNAPSFSGHASLGAVNEDATSPSGSTVGSLFNGLFVDPDTAYTPADTLAGIIITADASDPSEGEWQYSTDGTNWHSIGAVSTDAGLLLSSSSSLRFVPAADYNGTPGSLSAHAVDSSDNSISFTSGATRQAFDTIAPSATGGTAAVSSSAVSLNTSVTPVNDLPTLNASGTISNATEDTAEIITHADLLALSNASDVDNDAISFRVESISSGTLEKLVAGNYVAVTAGVTTLSLDETLRWTPATNANGQLGAFTVKAVDSQGGVSTTSMQVNMDVAAVNDPVSITGQSSVTLDEDSSVLINGFTVSDVEGDNITIRVNANHGNLTLDSAGSVTVTQSGGHTLEFSGALADVQAALNTLRYAGDADYFGSDELTIEASDDSGNSWQPYRVDEQGLFYNPANGHYYEYVSAPGITWDAAKTAAESRTLFGLNGYLATVTSAEENAFISPKLGGDGWMGASDAASEGVWRWVTGPEAGTLLSASYDNWRPGEPNDSGGEDVAHFYDGVGDWNDYANNNPSIDGYIVEYGGAGFGTLEAATLDITINGVNDTPAVTTVDTDAAITTGSLSDSGSITFTDADPSDRPTAAEVTKTVTAKLADGTTDLTLTDDQRTALENAFSISADASNDNNGTINWDYTIDAGDLEFLAEGEVVTAVFTITVDDGQGGRATQDVTVTLTGSNDQPEIQVVDVQGDVTDGSTLADSGSVTFTDVDLTDRPTATEATKTVTAKLADGTTDLTLTDDQRTALENAFSISADASNDNNGTINWDYTIDAGDLEFLAEGEVVTAVFTITVDDGQGGRATQDVTVTLTGSNDQPEIQVVDVQGDVTDGSTLADSGSVTFTDVDLTDRPTATEATKTVAAKRADGTTDLTLTGDQRTVLENAFSISANAGNDNNGTINWAYDIDAADLEFLAEGEEVTAVFTITVDDGQGGTDTQDVTVTLTGNNDQPEIQVVDVQGDITDGSTLADSGSVTFTDVDLTDRPTATEATKTVTAKRADGTTDLTLTGDQRTALENAFSISADAGNDNNGTINWAYDIDAGDLEFLAEGEEVTAVFTITVDDGQGGTDTQDVTVTLTGSNDQPEIQVVDVQGDITDGSTLADSGSVTFTDVDLTDRPTATEATKTVTAKRADGTTDLTLTGDQRTALENAFSISADAGNDNNGTINWAYDIDAADLEFLAEGEEVTAVFTITVDDGQGGTDTQDVTVTLTGTNDDPVVTVDAPNDFTEQADAAAQDLSQSGQVHFSDVDLTDTIDIRFVSNDDIVWTRADTSIVADLPAGLAADLVAGFSTGANSQPHSGQIVWNYDVSGLDLDFLNEGDQITFSYTVTVEDGQGATDETVVTVTLVGTNDAPEVTAREMTDDETIVQQGAVYNVEIASLFSDKDSTLSREDLDFTIAGLPSGLVYDAETGVVSGKPTESGNFLVTVTATDTEGASVERSYEMIVTAVVQNEAPVSPGDTTPPSAPETDTQSIETSLSDMPDGLVNDTGSTTDSTAGSGYMAPSTDTGLDTADQGSEFESNTNEPAGELGDNGDQTGGSTEQVILSEPGALVVQTQNPDGSTSVRASVDVSVTDDGEVVFSDVQQEAFSTVSLAVVSISQTADNELTINIQDTSPAANSQLYTGSLSSGESLPSWISLDPATGSVTLTNPPAGQKEVSLRIQAVGADGQMRVLELKLDLDELLKRSAEAEAVEGETEQEPVGFTPLSDQLEAELVARDQYGDRLMSLLQSA
jgi:VCBS repeat-containing protein